MWTVVTTDTILWGTDTCSMCLGDICYTSTVHCRERINFEWLSCTPEGALILIMVGEINSHDCWFLDVNNCNKLYCFYQTVSYSFVYALKYYILQHSLNYPPFPTYTSLNPSLKFINCFCWYFVIQDDLTYCILHLLNPHSSTTTFPFNFVTMVFSHYLPLL